MLTLFAAIDEMFRETPSRPPMSLRAGDAHDEHRPRPSFDDALDQPTAEYFESFHTGLHHLDAESWRYYLPRLMRYATDKMNDPRSMAIGTLLASLRPPDRDPPRFASLSPAQIAVVADFLDELAFCDHSVWQENAMIALEEYWGDGAVYRANDPPRRP